MTQPSKATDLARLAEIANLRELAYQAYDERCLIFARRVKAGDCAMTNQPKDRGQSELARIAHTSRAQVNQDISPERLAKAKANLRARRGSE